MTLKRLNVLVPPNPSEVELVLVVVRHGAKGAPSRRHAKAAAFRAFALLSLVVRFE